MPEWQKLKGWHDDAENSTGFGHKPSVPRAAQMTTPPAGENKYYDDDDVIAAAAECMPYYDAVLGRASHELEAAVACEEPADVPPPPPPASASEPTAPIAASGGAPIASAFAVDPTPSASEPESAGRDAAC